MIFCLSKSVLFLSSKPTLLAWLRRVKTHGCDAAYGQAHARASAAMDGHPTEAAKVPEAAALRPYSLSRL